MMETTTTTTTNEHSQDHRNCSNDHKSMILHSQTTKSTTCCNLTKTMMIESNFDRHTFTKNHNREETMKNQQTNNHRRQKKQVTFCLQQTAYFQNPYYDTLNGKERKAMCWYSDIELCPSRDDARKSIRALQQYIAEHERQDGNRCDNDETALLSSSSSRSCSCCCCNIESLQLPDPDDTSTILCLRGIEKYADAAAKYTGQKRLIGSVLYQQLLPGSKTDHIALVSQTLSHPFKDVAQYYALKCAEQLRQEEEEASIVKRRHEEQDKQDKVAVAKAVLLLIVGSQCRHERRLSDASSSSASTSSTEVESDSESDDSSSSSSSISSVKDDHHQDENLSRTLSHDIVTKRRRCPEDDGINEENRLHNRNVKPCIRKISE